MSLTFIQDHVARALDKLPAQFRDSMKLKALIESWIRQVQEIEDQLAIFAAIYDIDNATGRTLDIIGLLVGEGRGGRNDHDYRIWIRARLAVLVSGGTREDVIRVLLDITGLNSKIEITNQFPAKFDAAATVLSTTIPVARIEDFLRLGTLAGVDTTLTVFNENAFAFDTTGQGFDEGLFGEVF